MKFFLFLRRTEANRLVVTPYFAATSRVAPRAARAAARRLASFSDTPTHLRERKFRPGADYCKTSGRAATSSLTGRWRRLQKNPTESSPPPESPPLDVQFAPQQ